jgi:hypothetical protein
MVITTGTIRVNENDKENNNNNNNNSQPDLSVCLIESLVNVNTF